MERISEYISQNFSTMLTRCGMYRIHYMLMDQPCYQRECIRRFIKDNRLFPFCRFAVFATDFKLSDSTNDLLYTNVFSPFIPHFG